MGKQDYAVELHELNERADMLRKAAKQGASVIILMQLGVRLLEAERAVARAMNLFSHKGEH